MTDTMRDILNPSHKAQRDPDFPDAPEDWTKASAELKANEEGVELGSDHWQALRALQAYFAKHESPHIRELHDALDEKFHAEGGIRYLYELFPGGPVAQGCRIAGLEPPAGSTDKSFGSVM